MDFRVIYQGEKIMLIVREFSNRFQQMSGMPINSNETNIVAQLSRQKSEIFIMN